ncbi:MAG TPA: putative baseplate assembly protein [Geothrix sp.]|nr:putative baseplate assembly protein [Geothrix sp.]
MSSCGCAPGQPCGCCQGIQNLTPRTVSNRPGLPALSYRVGTQGTFLETMKARLSSADFPALAGLRTREAWDPAIALLDAWACVGDVLTFYQERLANEGYLRTAMERRSVLELANLVGYRLRPGVAASVYFAYTLEANSQPVVVPAGAKAQSIPDPGETAQTFETSEDLEAHVEWNLLKPRPTQPQRIDYNYSEKALTTDTVYFDGTATKLNPGDGLLFDFGGTRLLRHVKLVDTDYTAQRTQVILQEAAAPLATAAMATSESLSNASRRMSSTKGNGGDGEGIIPLDALSFLAPILSVPATPQLASAANLARSVSQVFDASADVHPQLLSQFYPLAASYFYQAWAVSFLDYAYSPLSAVYAMRVVASPFGTTAGKTPNFDSNNKVTSLSDWAPSGEAADLLFLDAFYGSITNGSPVAILASDGTIAYSTVETHTEVARSAYGLNGKSSKLDLTAGTWSGFTGSTIDNLRKTLVYAGAERLGLAEEPIPDDVQGSRITLDGLYSDFKAGRWVIVTGERTDVRINASKSLPGLVGTELAMISGVLQDVDLTLAGDTVHTTLTLAKPLAYTYRRSTVGLYGNVVKATHGETRNEVLGAGNAGPLQTFVLKQPPLTYVSAPSVDGIASTLQVRVNEVLWHEARGLAGLGPRDRAYLTRTDNEGKTSVVFGTGDQGLRPPTGLENIAAVYRNGIGRAGNVKAGQISLLASKPLGVKAVVNPLRASGGADKDTRDQARGRAPLGTLSLDRLVSVQDYADFAMTFGGIGKASATKLTDGLRQVVEITVAGAGDIPIDRGSDLYANLVKAFRTYGDPYQPIRVDVRELRLLVINAGVKVLPDYLWVNVKPKVQAALLDTFGFERRDLAQPAYLSEVIQTIQGIPGVAYVDVDALDSVPEGVTADDLAQLSTQLLAADQPHVRIPARAAWIDPTQTDPDQRIRAAQLTILSPAVPDTLNLKELT